MTKTDRAKLDDLRDRARSEEPCVTRRELADLLFDIDQLRQERDDAISYRDFLNSWYACRVERLKRLGRERGCLTEMSTILLSGIGQPGEPASYTRMMIDLRRRAEKAEAELARLRVKKSG